MKVLPFDGFLLDAKAVQFEALLEEVRLEDARQADDGKAALIAAVKLLEEGVEGELGGDGDVAELHAEGRSGDGVIDEVVRHQRWLVVMRVRVDGSAGRAGGEDGAVGVDGGVVDVKVG